MMPRTTLLVSQIYLQKENLLELILLRVSLCIRELYHHNPKHFHLFTKRYNKKIIRLSHMLIHFLNLFLMKTILENAGSSGLKSSLNDKVITRLIINATKKTKLTQTFNEYLIFYKDREVPAV